MLEINDVQSFFGAPIHEFKFKVPPKYNSLIHWKNFLYRKFLSNETSGADTRLLNNNFNTVVDTLKPGKTYRVEIVPTDKRVSVDHLLKYIDETGALKVGIQGLLIVRSHCKDKFPVGKYILSLGNQTSNFTWIPSVQNLHTDYESWGYEIFEFSDSFRAKFYCLLCVYEID